jgi:hypothetical protein
VCGWNSWATTGPASCATSRAALAKLAVSIDELQTQVASAAMSGDELFKVKALLAVPAEVSNAALRQALEAPGQRDDGRPGSGGFAGRLMTPMRWP